MSSVRATGAGMPSTLRINGQEITTNPSPSVEGPRPAGGVPSTSKPVPGPADTSAAMEEMFDDAHDAAIRGENAALMLQGKKPGSKRNIKKKKRKDAEVDHKRVDGVFPDGDPHNKQEKAFQEAAEFEEKVKETDLSFSRKAGQVEVSSQVFRADIDDGAGGLVAGESAREIQMMDEERTDVTRPPNVTVSMEVREDTVPNFDKPMESSETDLRRILGLKKK